MSNYGGYPGIGGMLHHGKNGIIKLVIVDVEHDLFSMQVRDQNNLRCSIVFCGLYFV
jgi:hypothetical protein